MAQCSAPCMLNTNTSRMSQKDTGRRQRMAANPGLYKTQQGFEPPVQIAPPTNPLCWHHRGLPPSGRRGRCVCAAMRLRSPDLGSAADAVPDEKALPDSAPSIFGTTIFAPPDGEG